MGMKSKQIAITRFDNFTDESKPLTKSFYNVLPSKNLKGKHGVAVAKFPSLPNSEDVIEIDISSKGLTSVDGLAFFTQYSSYAKLTTHRLLVYGNDKKVYINQLLDEDEDLHWLYSLQFDNPPIILTYKKHDIDTAIITDKQVMKIWQTGYSPYTINDVPIITSMCVNEGVLFCTIIDPAFKIWFCTDLDAGNIGQISKNSGYILLDDELGYARKVVSFKEDVYVFRDYGISKITFLQKERSVSQIYLSQTLINSNTVCVCGNMILFMTKDGVYSFNGTKVEKLSINIQDMIVGFNGGATANSLGNKYYLALKLNFNDGKTILCEQGDYTNNALMIIDTEDSQIEIIRGVDIKSLLPVKTEVFEKMLAIFNGEHKDKIGEIIEITSAFGNTLSSCWESENLCVDDKNKLFTSLSVDTNAGVQIKLKTEKGTFAFETQNNGYQKFHFKIPAREMKVEISSGVSNLTLDNLVLTYYEQ